MTKIGSTRDPAGRFYPASREQAQDWGKTPRFLFVADRQVGEAAGSSATIQDRTFWPRAAVPGWRNEVWIPVPLTGRRWGGVVAHEWVRP